MNKYNGERGRLSLGILTTAGWKPTLLSLLFLLQIPLNAQDEESPDGDAQEQMPSQSILAPGVYSFRMQLPPGVDVSVRIKETDGKAKKEKSQGDFYVPPADLEKIEREIRQGIVRTHRYSGETKMPDCYYVTGWCLIDDPRRGVSIRRPVFGSIIQEPMTIYHFPELTWANPKTLRVDKKTGDGERKIEIYQQGERVLEVDAITHRPLRFHDGNTVVWTYSYKESSAPIVLPENLRETLRRVMGELPP